MGWVVSVTLRPRFASGKGPPVPIVQEAGWAPEPVWTQRIEEKSFTSSGHRTPIARSSSPTLSYASPKWRTSDKELGQILLTYTLQRCLRIATTDIKPDFGTFLKQELCQISQSWLILLTKIVARYKKLSVTVMVASSVLNRLSWSFIYLFSSINSEPAIR
jgi:hypothetical protein